jgi:hypothetical protein
MDNTEGDGGGDGGDLLTLAQTPFLEKKPAKLSLGTVTTAAQQHHHLLETTDDSIDTTHTNNSSGSSDGTPFRFTSFPASLPRINMVRTTTKTTTGSAISSATLPTSCVLLPPSCHVGTVRKRMSFGEPLPVYPSQHYQAQQRQQLQQHQQQQQQQQQQQYHQFNNSNDNDMRMMMMNRSHDTSLSSVPDEACLYGYSDNEDDDDNDHHGDINNNNNNLEDDNDNDERLPNAASPIGTPVSRTRLNFSSAVSPLAAAAAAAPACASVASTAASSTSSQQHKPIGSSMTPLRSHDHRHHHHLLPQEQQPQQEAPVRAQQQIIRPGTPTEVKIHFAGGVQCCSPIRGIPEEEDDDGNADDDLCSSSKASSITTHVAIKAATRNNDAALSTSTCSASSTTSEGSSCNSSKMRMRQRRPMPDMTAFDGGDAMTTSASASLLLSRDRSGGGNDNATTTAAATSNASLQPPPPLSPKLLCPPTPVRTPAWAHYEPSLAVGGACGGGHHSLFKKLGGKFGRQNSLIATKVLATCSPQVLDGRTSLENSILEEEQRSLGSNGSIDQQQQQQHQNGRLSSSMTTLPRGQTEDTDVAMSEGSHRGHGQGEDEWLHNGARHGSGKADQPPAVGAVVSMSASFDILSLLGSGTFADVYKVRSKINGKLYAVKKNRRHFRGKRDREKALAEVRCMQRLQSVCASNADSNNVNNRSKMTTPTSYSLYLLFFYQAWQEEGHFFCQTELCCRDTCRELMDALRSDWCRAQARYPCLRRLTPPLQSASAAENQQHALGRLMPESTIWKICHDISGGLSHIHSHGLVHNDIKPSNGKTPLAF